MKFENIHVYNFEGAFRGMRNPMNSWNKSDSWFGMGNEWYDAGLDEVAAAWTDKYFPDWYKEDPQPRKAQILYEQKIDWLQDEGTLQRGEEDTFLAAYIGPNDMELAQRLIRAGSEHRKFMRQIFVTVDITAPLYWWKEMDTYKVATVSNSTSTMHKLASTPITLDCFEIDDYNTAFAVPDHDDPMISPKEIIEYCETLRRKYLETNDKRYWKELIRWLPESWLQTRTWTANYETIYSIIHQRKNHKLTEWSKSFMKFAESLPYAKSLLFIEDN